MARGRGRVLEGEERLSVRVGRWGKEATTAVKVGRGWWGWMALHHVKVKVLRGRVLQGWGEGGRGRDGLNVIHGRDRLLSVSYRCLSCEVHFFVSFSD